MTRSRGISATFFADVGIAQRGGEIRREHDHAPIRRQLAADQDVVDVGVGPELVDRADHIRETQAVVPGHWRRVEDVAFDRHALVERRPQPQDAQRVAVAQQLVAARRANRAAR